MNFTRISKLSDLVTNDLKRKPTIIIDPAHSGYFRISGIANDINVSIDKDGWVIPDKLESFITELSHSDYSIEERILKVYQKICEEYTYDDNVLSYIKKLDDDTFFLPDFYGRDTNSEWKEKRNLHNRRNCFEISRILAKSICEIFNQANCSTNYDVCFLWDEAVTHYLVGLACNNYYISLDLDDFTQIKDLTRLKTGLTAEGIKVLEDPSKKFGKVLAEFNKGKSKIAKDHIEETERVKKGSKAVEKSDVLSESYDVVSEDIRFLQYAIEVLKEEYNLDSAGMFEYLKEIIDTKIGAKSRQKVWKEIENNPGVGTRYTRCLLITMDNASYIIDVTKDNPSEIFRLFNPDEMERQDSKIKSFKTLARDWEEDPYDGR